jgi:two-component system chemotaxis sensor kinase CheA
VLTKNQVMGVARRMSESESGSDMTDEMGAVAGELDLVTASLQTAVTRTRLQPLAKLFDRYPRVIRDMARLTDKRIRLEIEGRETEVDKSVLELLGDPLVHILRNSADHGVEPPDQRAEAGKPETGTIRLIAEHQGSHVRIAIEDDGRGIDRAVIGRKAVDKGLASEDQIAAMSDDEVLQFIFAPGFSTASEVSDLSGRGVGMDVVRTNVRRMNGSIGVQSTPGRGSTIEILIPLTIAIMPALEVEVGAERYCLPLQSVVEIVRPQEDLSHTVDRRPVMRLRGTVLPLIELRDTLAVDGERVGEGFAVVVHAGRQRAGLVVDRLIGQKEIVIKPLDRDAAGGGPFSGATIQEDGRVSLILDVNGILQCGLDGDDTKHVKAA